MIVDRDHDNFNQKLKDNDFKTVNFLLNLRGTYP